MVFIYANQYTSARADQQALAGIVERLQQFTAKRIRIANTRAMIRAALSGALDSVMYERDQVFNLDVPTVCPDVPVAVLQPRNTWAKPADYDAQAAKLARMFAENFKTFEAEVTAEVKAAGPRL